MPSRKFLFACLILIVGLANCLHAKSAGLSKTAANDIFEFWYDPWQPNSTLKKVESANVIIGVPPSAVAEIHNSGRRALQYVTYYQSVLNHAFLKDRQDLSNVGFEAKGEFEKSVFGGEDNYVLCPNSIELRSRVLRFLDESIKQGFDGYFVDNTFLDPSAHEVCSAKHPHNKDGEIGGSAYLDLLEAVRLRIKEKNPAAILISNPGNPRWADDMASSKPSLWEISDLVLWESYGYTSYHGVRHDRWKRTIEESFTYAASPEKAAKLLVLSYPENLTEARFSFAIAKIFGFQWTANLGDKDQNAAKDGGHFGTFYQDIPLSLSGPLGKLPEKNDSLLHRVFQDGEVFVNTGATSQTISVPKGSAVYLGSQHAFAATGPVSIEPMTAAIVVKSRYPTKIY